VTARSQARQLAEARGGELLLALLEIALDPMTPTNLKIAAAKECMPFLIQKPPQQTDFRVETAQATPAAYQNAAWRELMMNVPVRDAIENALLRARDLQRLEAGDDPA
jgi:hypothetical protein